MPKRIEHRTENGIELKWCSKCELWLELANFHTTNHKTWDNRFYCCIDCWNDKRLNDPKRVAAETYRKMKDRCKNDIRYKDMGIKVLISRKDFIDWYVPRWFKGCLVDRKNNLGNYEIGNIQLLSLTEHNIKHRQDNLDALGIKEKEGERFCYKCSTLKQYSDFSFERIKISESNPLGLKEECKSCANKARRKLYKEHKND